MCRSKHELLILDCDGVLVDSERVAARVHAELLKELGITDQEILEQLRGRSHAFMLAQVEAKLGNRPPALWCEKLDERMHAAFNRELTPVDGIVEALDQIPIRTCVASNSRYERVCEKLRATGLYDRFEGRIFSSAGVTKEKPAPDLFLFVAEQMHVHPSRCAVVDDTIYGIDAARAAGMVGLLYCGLGAPETVGLEAHDGAVRFTDARELPRLLGLTYS